MSVSKISTFPRFLYLNVYAFSLAFGGIGIALIPCYKVGWWLVALQVIAFYVCERNAFKIFSSWNDKKRKYDILIQKNEVEFRPDTFTDYMQAPCGQLLAKIVLADLNKSSEYKNLLKLKKPLWKLLKSSCKPQKTVIFINENKP